MKMKPKYGLPMPERYLTTVSLFGMQVSLGLQRTL